MSRGLWNRKIETSARSGSLMGAAVLEMSMTSATSFLSKFAIICVPFRSVSLPFFLPVSRLLPTLHLVISNDITLSFVCLQLLYVLSLCIQELNDSLSRACARSLVLLRACVLSLARSLSRTLSLSLSLHATPPPSLLSPLLSLSLSLSSSLSPASLPLLSILSPSP